MVNWPPFISAAQMGHQRAIRGDGRWIKGALRVGMKAPSYSEAPYAHWGYRVRGVPGKMAFTECTSVSNNGISMPSVFFGGFWFVAGCYCRMHLSLWVQSCEWVVCSVMYVNVCTCVCGGLKGWCSFIWHSLTISRESKELSTIPFFYAAI